MEKFFAQFADVAAAALPPQPSVESSSRSTHVPATVRGPSLEVLQKICASVVELLTVDLPTRSRHKTVLDRFLLGNLTWQEIELSVQNVHALFISAQWD